MSLGHLSQALWTIRKLWPYDCQEWSRVGIRVNLVDFGGYMMNCIHFLWFGSGFKAKKVQDFKRNFYLSSRPSFYVFKHVKVQWFLNYNSL